MADIALLAICVDRGIARAVDDLGDLLGDVIDAESVGAHRHLVDE